ncbi:unnamed protein product [Spirodela intermedia]|uniref:Uncharacterized protein n=1 Tax=Spirodela intermedia TaxID=51605 RepID=A0A7I8LGM5_SPIIN|nr:unnamed protein product [Spirodela intermedia]
MPKMTSSLAVSPFLLLFLVVSLYAAAAGHYEPQQQQQQPLNPGDYTAAPVAGGEGSSSTGSTVPAFPVVQAQSNQTCHLDLSDELFGGVAEACGRNLDRGRCCPVLAAWLFAAHARSALQLPSPPPPPYDGGDEDSGGGLGSEMPMMPDDSQKCVDSLQSSLQSRNIFLARPNASCDAVLCFCGIRLHQIGSLSCPAAFNLTTPSTDSSGAPPASSSLYRNATPTAAVRNLEKSCRNSSYAGCTRCLQSLDMLRGGVGRGGAGAGGGDRASRMFGRDCQLMGLTWLLARNRTAYIPTVSAVLRAIMYSSHHLPPPHGGSGATGKQPQYRCSPDQENMPLAVDSLQFERLEDSAAGGGGGAVLPTVTAAVIFLFLFFYPIASP